MVSYTNRNALLVEPDEAKQGLDILSSVTDSTETSFCRKMKAGDVGQRMAQMHSMCRMQRKPVKSNNMITVNVYNAWTKMEKKIKELHIHMKQYGKAHCHIFVVSK